MVFNISYEIGPQYLTLHLTMYLTSTLYLYGRYVVTHITVSMHTKLTTRRTLFDGYYTFVVVYDLPTAIVRTEYKAKFRRR